ncbi:MAG: hypothetical protein NTU98_09430 [Bacteroidetes bacterium]|nr:hypothetical protein [Bacteroidota bacterium]
MNSSKISNNNWSSAAGRTEKYLVPFLLLFLLIVFLVISFLSEGFYGGADNINHYFISRYSWQRPELLFDGWGRPLYTILSSPFAQFGFQGIKVFNVILAVLTLWTGYLTARKLNYAPSLLAFVMIGFAPIYFIMIFTGLTEILAGFVLILAVYLFFREKYIASAVVLSFIYFARSEAMIFYPIFLAAYVFKKQYKAIPFLLVGVLFFTVIGGWFFNDYLWLIHKFPYPVHHKIYKETGPLLHFVNQRDYIFGIPLEILLVLGTIILFRQLFSKQEPVRKQSFYELLLILLPFAGYFAMHSVFYWKALGGSIGLIRVITAVMPLAGLICLKGYDFLDQKLKSNPRRRNGAMILTSVIIIIVTFITYHVPVRLDDSEKTLKAAAGWFKTSEYSKKLVFYTDLNFPFFLDINPNDIKRSALLFYARSIPTLPDSCVVVWESHFGPHENEIPLDTILNNKNYRLLKVFKPEKEFTTLGGLPYEVRVFLKLPADLSVDDLARTGWKQQQESEPGRISFFNDFEQAVSGFHPSKFTTSFSHSGSQSFRMDTASLYSPAFVLKWKYLLERPVETGIWVSYYIYPTAAFGKNPPSIVISLENGKTSYFFRAKNLKEMNLVTGRWNKAEMDVQLPAVNSLSDLLKIYIYNPSKEPYYIDDMNVTLLRKRK